MHRRTLVQSLLSTAGLAALGGVRSASAATAPSVARASTRFIQARDGTQLYYEDWGSGRPMVFVAPWALSSAWWEYHVASLTSHGVRCVTYDRRGHGRSDQPGRGYDFDTLAGDLASLFDSLDLRDVVLVGHSMGCAEVVRYLTKHGTRRVSRAVLVSTITPFILKAPDNPEGVDRSVLEAGRARLSKDRPHQIAIAAPAFFGSPQNAVSSEVIDWWARMMVDHVSLKTMLDLHRVFTETDFRPELPRITVPTLLIHGDIDTSTPLETTGRRTQRLIPNSRLVVYEKAAHGLPFTHMERLSADLLAFAGKE
jgi:pimeloyl-ACP methyl ester carboxylesterase